MKGGATGVVIRGNQLGTTADGLAALPDGAQDIRSDPGGSLTVGGDESGEGDDLGVTGLGCAGDQPAGRHRGASCGGSPAAAGTPVSMIMLWLATARDPANLDPNPLARVVWGRTARQWIALRERY